MYFSLFVGVLYLSLFCYALLCENYSFAIILKSKKKMVALLLLFYRCIVTINVCGSSSQCQCVIVVFLDHTPLVFH